MVAACQNSVPYPNMEFVVTVKTSIDLFTAAFFFSQRSQSDIQFERKKKNWPSNKVRTFFQEFIRSIVWKVYQDDCERVRFQKCEENVSFWGIEIIHLWEM